MLQTVFILAVTAVGVFAHHEEPAEYRAIVKLTGADINGNITFTQQPDGKVRVFGTVYGLNPGQYGFHVHQLGDITGGCTSTGGHYNPEHKTHGHPKDEIRHVGDLGNIVFDQYKYSNIDFVDHKISLVGPFSIIGRSIVLHQGTDDFGRSTHPDSKTTGNAGGRAACGVIGILSPQDAWNRNGAVTISVSTSILLMMFTLSMM